MNNILKSTTFCIFQPPWKFDDEFNFEKLFLKHYSYRCFNKKK